MAGAGKKRQQAGRRRADTSRAESSAVNEPGPADTPDTPSAAPQTAPAEQAEQAVQPQQQSPFGYDGADAPPMDRPDGIHKWVHPGNFPSGKDPVRELEIVLLTDINRRLDLPSSAFNLDHLYEVPTELPRRPGFNTSGKEATIRVNSYNILKYPERAVYQYDIHIGDGAESRALIRKVWQSDTVKKATGPSWIFDGNKLAWAVDNKAVEQHLTVDLDAEANIKPRAGRDNKHRITIRQTKKVPLGSIDAYLKGTITFDNSVLEAINFLDHLLRHEPSMKHTAIRQSFFARGKEKVGLGGGVEAFKGVFQSMRICQGGRLNLNVDVSNGSFFSTQTVLQAAVQFLGARDATDMIYRFDDVPLKAGSSEMVESPAFGILQRMQRVRITPKHRNLPKDHNREYTIDRFIHQNALQYKFETKNPETGKREIISVYDYFLKKYNVTLLHNQVPLIQTTKKGVVIPMEVAQIKDNQKYPFKLDEYQTAKMIKFAVTRPDMRMKDIEDGIALLNWKEDVFLRNYGMTIDPEMIQTKCRVLPPPTVQFNGSTVSPGTSGRWDLRGPRRFLTVNTEPLSSWCVCWFPDRMVGKTIDKAVVERWTREFIKTYQGHGGRVAGNMPAMFALEADAAKGVEAAFTQTGQICGKRPQILIFVLSDRTSFHYARIKKSADCRFGVLTQCVQSAHVLKGSGQYISNVCMKLNAKLGGSTAKVANKHPTLGHFKVPSLIIGADVSHAAAGLDAPSMAAISVSLDSFAVRYAAACETNGKRVEMIHSTNIRTMVVPLVGHWIRTVNNGNAPQHVYYFRDGVSEGQYQHVLRREVADMKAAFKEKMPNWSPKFIVVVASKRHHTRFFPRPRDGVASDRNQNPVPGVIVERDVTHPFENDFYLCSHSAIQGTARPVHYHVLLDEAGIPVNQLHQMIYEQCYSYIRSTTPVSLHPAVYYAHLASNRARSHENIPASSGPRTGQEAAIQPKKKLPKGEKPKTLSYHLPLLPFADLENSKMDIAMWYI
ncbi:MAG: hypothetical protein M1826_005016 [Phylliscum demangeonii]|nr:MAG: hypothetical protein M1826_005016 [Phylliscum demangeonii]